MKAILIFSLFLATSVHALNINCSFEKPSNALDTFTITTTAANDKIEYASMTLHDASGTAKDEALYSLSQNIRGGQSVKDCIASSEANSFNGLSGSTYSICSGVPNSNIDTIVYHMTLSSEVKIEYTITSVFGVDDHHVLHFINCK